MIYKLQLENYEHMVPVKYAHYREDYLVKGEWLYPGHVNSEVPVNTRAFDAYQDAVIGREPCDVSAPCAITTPSVSRQIPNVRYDSLLQLTEPAHWLILRWRISERLT